MDLAIEWYGHSYTLIETGNKRIVIDPHDGGSLNLPEFRVEADIVLITHNHYDHNAVEMVRKANHIFEWFRGEKVIGEIKVRGFKSYHDKSQGKIRGENTVYEIETPAGVRVAHLGDIGHKPDGPLLERLRGVDILLVPVGGVYTVDAYEAWEIVEMLQPRIVIPIHFWVPKSTVPLDPLDKFLNVAKAGRTRLETNRLEANRKALDKIKRTIIVMPDPHSLAARSEQ